MGRKLNAQDHVSSYQETNHTNDTNPDGLYRKRLRSWKRTTTHPKRNQVPAPSAVNHHDNEITPLHRSTMYTYPINLSNDRQRILSNTIHSESLTTDSAFYCPSISSSSIQTNGDLNNNHVTTFNVERNKRKTRRLSCESLCSEHSQSGRLKMLLNPDDEKTITAQQTSNTHLQLAYHQSPTKRSRLSTDDSIITNHRSLHSLLPIDSDTIDINQLDQQESLSPSINNESLTNNSNSMEVAVKMVQPIVDIIFNAFEDQLKNVQGKPIEKFSLQPLHSSPRVPHFPLTSPAHPVVLHAVNFNIQLSTKQPTVKSIDKQSSTEQYLTNVSSNETDYLQSISLTELKRKVTSCVLFNNLLTDSETNNSYQRHSRQLKRIVQLAIFGVSVLCGYLLL